MKQTYEKRWGHSRTRKAVIKAAIKAKKRREAEARSAAWVILSTADKVAFLKTRRGNCAKQLARLA